MQSYKDRRAFNRSILESRAVITSRSMTNAALLIKQIIITSKSNKLSKLCHLLYSVL